MKQIDTLLTINHAHSLILILSFTNASLYLNAIWNHVSEFNLTWENKIRDEIR